jgi:hypothetical protein
MAARTTMAKLIALARSIIADPTGSSAHFTDEQVQTALDARRQIVRFRGLETTPTPTSSGLVYLDFQSAKYYEDGAKLQNANYATVTPTSADCVNGVYTFESGQLESLYISGTRFDVYGAAADLAEEWAASLKGSIDFSADGGNFSQSQKVTNLERLAAKLRTKSEGAVRSISIERSDTL